MDRDSRCVGDAGACDPDRQTWLKVTAAVRRAHRSLRPSKRRPVYCDLLIARMYLWAAWHDRPMSWACDRRHYGRLFRPRKLPSVSRFGRRVRTPRVQALLGRAHEQLAGWSCPTGLSYFDGKPMTVSAVSKDKDARAGRVSGGFAKGYKLHAWGTEDGRLPVWLVTPLNAAEQVVALRLVARLPPLSQRSLVLADSNYDSADLHTALAERGTRLLAPLKAQQRVKHSGHHPVTLRQMGPARREAVAVWKAHPHLARFVLDERDDIDRTFAALTCFGGGLGPLPAWVRGTERVTRWVGAKMILYHARLQVRKASAA